LRSCWHPSTNRRPSGRAPDMPLTPSCHMPCSGGAIGRFNHSDPSTGIGKNNAFNAGFLASVGVDWLITPGVFVRAEWEYIAFATLNGTMAQVNTGQLAIGVKF